MIQTLCWPLLVLAWLTAASVAPAELDPAVASWLAAQERIQTWSADFVQTRTLKSLTQPLTTAGHVWFAAPNRFRWELGKPPQTIAVRAPGELQIFYPRLKRVERFPLTAGQTGPWRDALALLEAGFPRSESELQKQYHVRSQSASGRSYTLVLEPKSASARRMIPQVTIVFDTESHLLLATQLQFADGSTMRNDFKDPVLNPETELSQFEPEIPSDFKVVEPLRKN